MCTYTNCNILQRKQCASCSELPEAHFYYYAHHNKQLTIRVKRLPDRIRLSGEAEAKLWMWSRCGRCTTANGVPKSTKRVVISTAACGLSFGKFLELSFSHHSSSTRLSSCGHSLHRDFLYFFGYGFLVCFDLVVYNYILLFFWVSFLKRPSVNGSSSPISSLVGVIVFNWSVSNIVTFLNQLVKE